jgi:hypothetical protein
MMALVAGQRAGLHLSLPHCRHGPRTSATIRATNGFTRFACGMSLARFASSEKVTGLAGRSEFQVAGQPKPYELNQIRIQKKPGTPEGIQYESER